MNKVVRIVFGVPLMLLFLTGAAWEFLQLRLSTTPEAVGYDIAGIVIMGIALYIAWRAWRWVSGKETLTGKPADQAKK